MTRCIYDRGLIEELRQQRALVGYPQLVSNYRCLWSSGLGLARYKFAPWHFLNFFPDPHGHGSLRPTLLQSPVLPTGPPAIPGTAAGAIALLSDELLPPT